MEQRKLIRLGNSSYAIALPKEWVEKSGLKKGDNIFIEKNSNGELIIMPKYIKENEKSVAFDFSGKENRVIQTELIASYLQGINIFKIKKNLDKKKFEEVKSLVGNLISFEIIEDNSNEIIVKDVFSIEEANISMFFRRMDNILRSMLEDLEVYLKRGKVTNKELDDIYNADKDVTKFYLLINRLFILGLNNPSILNLLKTDQVSLMNFWWNSFNIEEIGDEIKRVTKILNISHMTTEKIKPLLDLFIEIKNLYIDCLISYYKKDKELAYNIISLKEKIIQKCDKYAHDENSTIAKIAEKFKKIKDCIHENAKMIVYTSIEENGKIK